MAFPSWPFIGADQLEQLPLELIRAEIGPGGKRHQDSRPTIVVMSRVSSGSAGSRSR